MATHICHAIRCTNPCPPKHLMCPKHWAMVPDDLQKRVYATYQAGQEKSKDVTREWFYAAQAAIESVREMEYGEFLSTKI